MDETKLVVTKVDYDESSITVSRLTAEQLRIANEQYTPIARDMGKAYDKATQDAAHRFTVGMRNV